MQLLCTLAAGAAITVCSAFCKFGRYTLSDPAKQASATDCLPTAGHGLQLKNGSFDFTLEQLQAEAAARQLSTAELLAELPMEVCPEGTFSAAPSWAVGLDTAAQALAQTCQTCANVAVTVPGSSGAASCSRAGERVQGLGLYSIYQWLLRTTTSKVECRLFDYAHDCVGLVCRAVPWRCQMYRRCSDNEHWSVVV
jgi:hypothetical protein